MHYRDGTPIAVGDKVKLADPSSPGPEIPAYAKDHPERYEGLVLAADPGENGCGAGVAAELDFATHTLQGAACSQKQALLVPCRLNWVPAAWLAKVALLALVLAAVLSAAPALAAETAPAPSAGLSELLVQYLLLPTLGAFALVLTGAATAFTIWLKGKASSSTAGAREKHAALVGSKALSLMTSVVRGLWAEMREEMEKAAADGVLTDEEKKKLREEAVKRFGTVAGEALKTEIADCLGVAPGELSIYAAGLTEQAVTAVKLEQAGTAAVRAQADVRVAEAEKLQLKARGTLGAILALVALPSAFLWSAPASAQPTWSAGPTIPFLMFEPGLKHPVSIQPGAGVQLSFSLEQLQREIGGKQWDLLSLDAMAFGSLVNKDDQQFGALSLGLAACTMGSLVCVGGGKRLIDTDVGPVGGREGWFIMLALSFNIGLAEPEDHIVQMDGGSKPVAIAKTPRRGNTLYIR